MCLFCIQYESEIVADCFITEIFSWCKDQLAITTVCDHSILSKIPIPMIFLLVTKHEYLLRLACVMGWVSFQIVIFKLILDINSGS